MKRYPFFLAVIICALASCVQEDDPKIVGNKLVPATIVAESSGFGTRSTATWNNDVERYNIQWEADDELSVFTGVDTGNHKFTAIQSDRLATFTGELPESATNIYPIMPYDQNARIEGTDVYTSIPAEQDGDFYNVVLAGWPRSDTRAESDKDFKHQFEAVSGILKFHFDPAQIADCDGNPQHVVRLSITADRPIAGDAKISFGSGTPVMTAVPNGTGSNMHNTITISAPDGAQSLPEGDYYIATLPINKTDISGGLAISVKCETKEGEVAYINATIGKAGKDHILTANVVKNIGTVKTTNYVHHFTSGEFTVDKNGNKVSFSPGNLQYRASDNSWRFALNQWDAQGEMGNSTGPNNTSGDEGKRATQSEWIDLFPWGHTGWADTKRSYLPYTSDNHAYSFVYCGESYSYRNEVDWGKYCDIQNGNNLDLKGTWRVPTLDEFKYMLCLVWADPGNTGESHVNSGRIDKVTTDPGQEGNENQQRRLIFMKLGIRTGVYVEGKEVVRFGLMIFPDGFTWPTALANKKPSRNVYSNKNVAMSLEAVGSQILAPLYTLTDLVIFEKAGCVFLPAAGNRGPAGKTNEIYHVNITNFNMGGYYWSTNKSGSPQLAVYSASLSYDDNTTHTQARSVRLVKNVPAATAEHEGVENDGDYNF